MPSIWWPRQIPKVGAAAVDQLLDHRHGIFAGRRRIAWAVGEKHAVGLQREDVLGAGLAGTTVTLQPASASRRRMLRFTP